MLVKALVRPLALRPCLVLRGLRERASNCMKKHIKTWMTCQVSDTLSADADPLKSGAYDPGGSDPEFPVCTGRPVRAGVRGNAMRGHALAGGNG